MMRRPLVATPLCQRAIVFEPPHFHVTYGGERAVVGIDILRVVAGRLSRRAEGLVLEWAESHQVELAANWERCRNHLAPLPIAPLE